MANNSEGISTKVGVKGDKEYKSALQQISRQLTVLNTDMKASQSAFGNQAETMDGMHDRLEKPPRACRAFLMEGGCIWRGSRAKARELMG